MKNFLAFKISLGFLAFAGLLVSTELRALESCELNAYVVDKDPKGLNVREAPDSKSKILAVIPQDANGTIVEVRGSEGQWLQIAHAENIEGQQAFKGKGWVFASLLATGTRFDGQSHILYSQADSKSASVGKIQGEQEVVLVGCKGSWPKVRWKSLTGYLAPDRHCPNPVTTCP